MTRSDNLVDRLRDVGWCGWDTQQEAAAEIERLRLTDAERQAVEWVIARIIDLSSSRDEDKKAAALRGLLKRLG